VKITAELVARMTQMRLDGRTQEEVALALGVAIKTVQRHTPRGIDHHTRGRKPWTAAANAASPQSVPEPQARIVRPSVARGYR
jgi:DNA-directed RNA polymerase specialized sigma24 family protein